MRHREAPFNPEGESKFGVDVTVRNYWMRHAQKQSGEVFAASGIELTKTAISKKGQEQSVALGTTVEGKKHGVKGYVSTSERTDQTLEKILEGYRSSNPDAPIRNVRVREELSSTQPKDFLKLYDDKFSVEKRKILDNRGLSKDDFGKLSPDEQEAIAEQAEEPVLREWLEDPEGDLAKLYPPKAAAAQFARIFRRHAEIARRLNSRSEVDLFHVTHKSISEPFLVSGALLRVSDGKRVTSLSELGGSLETLGGWESEAHTDAAGNLQNTVRIRGEEYQIDADVLEGLLEERTDVGQEG